MRGAHHEGKKTFLDTTTIVTCVAAVASLLAAGWRWFKGKRIQAALFLVLAGWLIYRVVRILTTPPGCPT